MYLKILEEIKKKNYKELREELEKQKKKQKENFTEESIQEKRAKSLIWIKSNSYIKWGEEYLKSIKMPSLTLSELEQEEKQYRKECDWYKSTMYIKYIYMKLYFDNLRDVESKNYFNEFYNIVRIYAESLEKALSTLSQTDKIKIDINLEEVLRILEFKV